MEVLVYLIITAIWWFSSFTFLMPLVILLQISKSFRDLWFAFFFTKIMSPLFADKFLPKRKQIFKVLEDHLPNRKKSKPLEILEIGIGSGANLEFYPENSNLTALDMNPNFLALFQQNKKNYPQVNYKETILNWAEDMKDVKDSSFDVVVSTHTLCSVKDVTAVLKEVKRVLKPGGKYIFLEHVAFPKFTGSYFVQILAAPLWNIYFAGCVLNRRSADSIKTAGFSDVHCDINYSPLMWLYFRPHVTGIATK